MWQHSKYIYIYQIILVYSLYLIFKVNRNLTIHSVCDRSVLRDIGSLNERGHSPYMYIVNTDSKVWNRLRVSYWITIWMRIAFL